MKKSIGVSGRDPYFLMYIRRILSTQKGGSGLSLKEQPCPGNGDGDKACVPKVT